MLHVFYTLSIHASANARGTRCNGVVDIYLSEQHPDQIIPITEDTMHVHCNYNP